ncbi:hypothetical protein P0J05_001992 [Vibrio vulnificus]|nr:hypothetical protein [Vibrio vulnificus]EGQ7958213.1 hypothetical protein [Vibrio vulnificus]EGR0650953.1 hypothetical protein [Vibrio vulnificus]EKO5199000.1 hypothetical protein [Vibrio vulnificus]PUZ90272.1 hypothetical protein DC364_23140 [Vibrio vulnificus]
MIAFTNDIKALQEAEAASVDLTTVTLEAVVLADYQDAEKRAELLKKYAYQLKSLENLPVYNRTSYLSDDLHAH